MGNAVSRRPRRPIAESLEPRQLLASGDIFYVAASGSNANDGSSPSQAWATLQHAADQVAAGETVEVLPGNYRGFDLRTSGQAGEPITFRAQSGAVINQVNPVTNDGINIEQASYVVIDGFTVSSPSSSTRTGIRVVGDGFSQANAFSHHVTVRNNRVSNWGRWGILTGFSDDLLIENNTLSGSVLEHGVYVSNSGDRPVIRNNVIFNNRANGIHMNGDIFTGDTSLPDVDGVIDGAVVSGNVIYGNGVGGGSAINGDGVVNARIENNLVYDNHASGISLYQIDGGAPSTGGVIVNNTIVNASDARWVINLRNGATGATVFNNILYNLNTSSVRGAIAALEGSDAGLTSDYNFVDPRFSLVDGTAATSLTAWRAATGNDQHSQPLSAESVDALFRNFAARDLTLDPQSAAIDFGISSLAGQPAPTTDQAGNARPGGAAVDAGALESAPQPPAGRRQSLVAVADGKLVVARSDGTQFTREIWSDWADSSTSPRLFVADLNGDDLDDALGLFAGQWHVAISTGSDFQTAIWGTWSSATAWRDMLVADFSGDGLADVAARAGNGKWWVARSNGTQFVNEVWGVWSRPTSWQHVRAADIDGDGRRDIVGSLAGQWWVARSNGTSFVNQRFGSWANDPDWKFVQVGDFDGDGRDDVAGQLRGRWWIGHSGSAQFDFQSWGSWSTNVAWQNVLATDVNADGRTDIAGRTPAGKWWVARSTGSSFVTELWGQWQTDTWLDVLTADVNGDGRADLVGRAADAWWVARSTGASLVGEMWGQWPPGTEWHGTKAGWIS